MKFITSEQFNKADKKVKDNIISWWHENIEAYDLYSRGKSQVYIIGWDEIGRVKEFGIDDEVIPLLTVGQLIKFIEGETGYYLAINYDEENNYGYMFDLGIRKHHSRYCDLLKALWEVAQGICL